MRVSAPLLTLIGTAGGVAAAVVAYQTSSAAGPTEPAADSASSTPAPVSTTEWLPCDEGWTLQGNECVRVQEKVLTVSGSTGSASTSAGRHSGRDHDEDDAEDALEDLYDDHGGDRDDRDDDDDRDDRDDRDDHDDHDDRDDHDDHDDRDDHDDHDDD